jgi:hypothetical protein
MGRAKFKYRLFRASNEPTTFWRWEVYELRRRRALEGGMLHGTIDDAKRIAEAAIFRLTYRKPSGAD